MELRNVETFVTCVESGSFSRAAQILGYTQSTATVHIKQLEDEFGVLLFERIGRGVQLTEEGRRFYKQALKVTASVRDTEQMMKKNQEPAGLLRLGSVASLSTRHLPGRLMTLHERFPKIRISLESEDPATLLDLLRHSELDILYIMSDEISGDDLVTAYEQIEPLHFVAQTNHPLAAIDELEPSDLLTYDMVLSPKTQDIVRRCMGPAANRVDPFLLTGLPNLILSTLYDGNAISLLPDYVTRPGLEDGRLTRLNIKGFDEYYIIKIVYHKNKWVTPQMAAFITMLKESA